MGSSQNQHAGSLHSAVKHIDRSVTTGALKLRAPLRKHMDGCDSRTWIDGLLLPLGGEHEA